MTLQVPAVTHNFGKVLAEKGLITSDVRGFGPHGFQCNVTDAVTGMGGSIVVTQADHPDYPDVEWLHASLAWAEQDPSYAEMHALHLAVFGRRRWSYQVNAPQVDHVNIHEHALHLFGRVDGQPMLPDFTRGTGSI